MIETRTYRAPSLREAMRLAHRDMGTSAMVVHSGPVHVPRQPPPVAFDVVATGEPTLPANEATTGGGTLPLDARKPTKPRKLWRASRAIAPKRPRGNSSDTAKVLHLTPRSTPSERLTERLADLRNRFDFFVRSQEEMRANRTQQASTHLRLVEDIAPAICDTRPPWRREEPTSVAIVGPRGADKSYVALEMASAGLAAGKDTVLVHVTLGRDPAMEGLLERAGRRGIEAHAIQSSEDLQTLQHLLGEIDLMIVDAPPHNPFSAEEIESVAQWHKAGLEPLLVAQPQAKPEVLSRIVCAHAERGAAGVTTARATLAKKNSPLTRAAEEAGIPVFVVPPADAARQILPTSPRSGHNTLK